MTKLPTIVSLAGVLLVAVSSFGSVPYPSQGKGKVLPPTGSNPRLHRAVPAVGSRRSFSRSPAKSGSESEEQVVVIIYGARPGSWL
jgi:hypothetical protein